ncbi:MAG: hypothetical protein VX874_19190 [Pseudomonadota bacterium]|nr:hypothetical protein [Pseudomonadota bacterium]
MQVLAGLEIFFVDLAHLHRRPDPDPDLDEFLQHGFRRVRQRVARGRAGLIMRQRLHALDQVHAVVVADQIDAVQLGEQHVRKDLKNPVSPVGQREKVAHGRQFDTFAARMGQHVAGVRSVLAILDAILVEIPVHAEGCRMHRDHVVVVERNFHIQEPVTRRVPLVRLGGVVEHRGFFENRPDFPKPLAQIRPGVLRHEATEQELPANADLDRFEPFVQFFRALAEIGFAVGNAIGEAGLVIAPMVKAAQNRAVPAFFVSDRIAPVRAAVLEPANVFAGVLNEDLAPAEMQTLPIVLFGNIGRQREEMPHIGQLPLFGGETFGRRHRSHARL